jgi:hypothetical protein
MRLVALGDSITSDTATPMPGGGWRGWAALLAEAVGAELHNLASSDALEEPLLSEPLVVSRFEEPLVFRQEATR